MFSNWHSDKNWRGTSCIPPLWQLRCFVSKNMKVSQKNSSCRKMSHKADGYLDYFMIHDLKILLTKLFQLIILSGCVPNGFKHSYIVPIPKVKDTRTKALTCNDFRGIAISPIISKVFEYCVIDRFKEFFGSADNQFGFRKGSSCSHAVYSTRCIVDSIINKKPS